MQRCLLRGIIRIIQQLRQGLHVAHYMFKYSEIPTRTRIVQQCIATLVHHHQILLACRHGIRVVHVIVSYELIPALIS